MSQHEKFEGAHIFLTKDQQVLVPQKPKTKD